ncbi:thioredoxin family protein [Cellulomonas marina]|uniref:Thioredoxin n=1 Tax=Cellulomonas marina TaxID=988821 RepID=A0A1I0VL75_9CELL|nr:thioredoxin family protein [Cellulomonas marina]GIG27935.1 hypothetical protein Cma02nite_05350 [Cellulomonas marina]SFA76326.1 Thioredoxin [Cellulomonas marina]
MTPSSPEDAPGAAPVLPADRLGSRATFLQLSTGFCAPCRAARRVLERVVATTDGVAHVEVDVAHDAALAARFEVVRTPTVVVLDAGGRPVARLEGVPGLARARALVAALDG